MIGSVGDFSSLQSKSREDIQNHDYKLGNSLPEKQVAFSYGRKWVIDCFAVGSFEYFAAGSFFVRIVCSK